MIPYIFFLLCCTIFCARCSEDIQDSIVLKLGEVSATSYSIPTRSYTLALSYARCAWLSNRFDHVHIKQYSTNHEAVINNPAKQENGCATRVGFSATGNYIFAASILNKLYMAPINAAENWKSFKLDSGEDTVQLLVPSSHKDSTIAYGDIKNNLMIYDVHQEKEICSLRDVYRKEIIRSCIWHPYNDALLMRVDGEYKASLAYWDMREKKPLYLDVCSSYNKSCIPSSISISPDGVKYSAINDTDVTVFDMGTRKPIFSIPINHKVPAVCVGFISNKDFLFCTDKGVGLLDLSITSFDTTTPIKSYEFEGTERVEWHTPTRTLIRIRAEQQRIQLLQFLQCQTSSAF